MYIQLKKPYLNLMIFAQKRVNSHRFWEKLRYTKHLIKCYTKSIKSRFYKKTNKIAKEDGSMYTVWDIANWFLGKSAMTNKKLQKMCYYAQAWSYAFNNCRMFDGDFEAWVHGPVNRSLWQYLKDYGYLEIEQNKFAKLAKPISNEGMLELLEDVWATYGEFTGGQLESLTHREPPWKNARAGLDPYEPSNVKIRTEDMHTYYNSLRLENGG